MAIRYIFSRFWYVVPSQEKSGNPDDARTKEAVKILANFSPLEKAAFL
jgi:hypothetical protein